MKFNSFRKIPGPKFGEINWAPHCEIVLEYDHPDGSTQGDFPKYYFENRHVRPDVGHDWSPRVDRDSPGMDETPLGCHVSATSLPSARNGEGEGHYFSHFWTAEELTAGSGYREGDNRTAHQRDWDTLVEAVGAVFQKHGVTSSSAPIDRIRCLVELQDAHRGKVYPSRNPVDVLTYSSFCTGASNLMAALCMVAGIPARNINNAVHSMTEIWDGQKWIFSDNLPNDFKADLKTAEPNCRPVSLFPHLNYSQLLLSPSNADGSPLPSELAVRYKVLQPEFEPYFNAGTADWRFDHGSVGLNRCPTPTDIGVGLYAQPCPDNVKAIYPEWETPHFFSIPGRENELILNPRQGWFHSAARLDRGLGMRKSFHIGNLESEGNPIHRARCDLHLVEGFGCEFEPGRAGWRCLVNDTEIGLDRKSFRLSSGLLSISLPIELLVENSTNSLTLLSEKSYDRHSGYRMRDLLPIWVYPDGLGTEIPWYGDDNYEQYMYKGAPRTGNGPVINSHSGWLFVPEGI